MSRAILYWLTITNTNDFLQHSTSKTKQFLASNATALQMRNIQFRRKSVVLNHWCPISAIAENVGCAKPMVPNIVHG